MLVGKSFDVVQVSRGALHGQFSMNGLGSMVLLEIRTNQRLLLNGDRGADCMSFCFEATGLADEHLMYNKPIAPYSLNGFRQGQKESHFQLTANTNVNSFGYAATPTSTKTSLPIRLPQQHLFW